MKKQFLAMGALLAAAALSADDASAQRRVLVFGPGGQAAINDLRANVPAVRDAGPTQGQFTIATEAMWRAMTTAQFAAYNAIWIDGGACATPADRGTSMFQAVTDTRGTWSAAITGHFEIIGSDSDFHIGPSRKFLTNSYHYVTSGAGTGLFVSTSCLFYTAPADTPSRGSRASATSASRATAVPTASSSSPPRPPTRCTSGSRPPRAPSRCPATSCGAASRTRTSTVTRRLFSASTRSPPSAPAAAW